MTDDEAVRALLKAKALFGGLPLECGPLVAVEHLESVARLGAAVLPHSSAILRTQNEVEEGVQAAHEDRKVAEWGLYVVNNPQLFAEIPTRKNPDEGTFAYGLSDELCALAANVESQFGILEDEKHAVALILLHDDLLGANSRPLLLCLTELCEWELHRWGIREIWSAELSKRIEAINVSSLIFGLHELRRAPWREYGGIIAGRVATPAYQSALRSLNRDVVISLAMYVWSWSLFTATWEKQLAVVDLLETCVPFALPHALDSILRVIGRLYMDQQFGAVVVLCRSALEVAMTTVNRSLGGEPELNLATVVNALARQEVLTPECARVARDLRVRGNKAVHEDLMAYEDRSQARKAIQQLTFILGSLRPVLELKAG